MFGRYLKVNKHFPKVIAVFFSTIPFAASYAQNYSGISSSPQPTSCIKTSFSKSGSPYWSTVTLNITNQCKDQVDLNNALITFNSSNNLNTSFYGSFAPLSYPVGAHISSSRQGESYLASINLKFPTQSWAKTKLAVNGSVKINYGVAKPSYVPISVKVYLSHPEETGTLDLVNKTQAKPFPATNPTIDIDDQSGKLIQKVELPWSGEKQVALQPGSYNLHPENLSTKNGETYQGKADPSRVQIKANNTISSNVTYQQVIHHGVININASKIPSQLSGYTKNPMIKLSKEQGGSLVTKTIAWDKTSTINHLSVGMNYDFSANDINFNQLNCQAVFKPKSAKGLSTGSHAVSTYLSYHCSPVKMDNIQIDVSGLTSKQKNVDVVFTADKNIDPIHKTVDLNNGKGSASVALQDGLLYNVSSSQVSGFGVKFSPQTLPAKPRAKETITYSKGAAAGQIPGWPNYLAMGTITNNSPVLNDTFAEHPVDAIFKYAGSGGDGDPGHKLQPKTTEKTMSQARYIENNSADHHKVMPVMVVYTIQMSGGLNFPDVTNENYLMDHYINLIRIARAMESKKDSKHPHPGTIILNPDFFGAMQQQHYQKAATQIVRVNKQLQAAINYLKQHDANFPKTVAMPQFKNNLIGYMQSINWAIRHFSPDVPFGWQENLWAPGSANWVHRTPELESKIANNVFEYINKLKVYQGPYKPYFIAFDKYERDAFYIPNTVWFYDRTDWNTYIKFVGDVAKKLGMPAIIWQIPGGHMLTKSDTSGLPLVHVSTAPDYFFGDPEVAKTFPNNILSGVLKFPLGSASYKSSPVSVKDYLQSDSDKNWGTSELQNAVDHNIVAILWGGGSTVGVVSIGSNGDDGFWLANKVKAYYKNPVKLH